MNDFNPDARDFQDWAEENSSRFRGTSTPGENFESAIGGMFEEDLSVSSKFNSETDDNNAFDLIWRSTFGEDFEDRQAKKIQDLAKEGKIPQNIIDTFTDTSLIDNTEWNDIAEYVNEFIEIDEPIQTRKEFDETNKRVLAERREYRNGVSERAELSGDIAGFGGTLVGGGLDPISIVTMPLAAPLTGVKGLSRSMYTFQVARNSALLNAGISTSIEPFIHDWKDKIGSQYTWKDSMINISASALFGGAISGVGANLGFKYTGKSFLSKDRDSLIKSFEKIGATKEEAIDMANYQESVNNAPYKDKSAEEFIEELETAREKTENEFSDIKDTTVVDDIEGVTTKIEDEADADLTKAVERKTEKVEAKSQLDKEFDDIPDSIIMEREDGSVISAKSLPKDAIEENKALREIQECLASGK